MEFRETYPGRVTLGKDGVYRWSADVDLREDVYSRKVFMKVMYIITGSLLALTLLIMLFEQNFSLAWVPVACCGAVLLIGMGSYRLYRAIVHDTCTVAYEMSGDDILQIRSPGEQKMLRTLGTLSTVLGMAAGKAAEGAGRGAAYSAAAEPVRTVFRKVRRIREYPEDHMILLKSLILTNTIRVPAEDYDMVLGFLRERTEEAIRSHPENGFLQRTGIAFALSAAVNTVIAVINYIGFTHTKRLPVSVTTISGAYARQDAFAMRVIYVPEGAGFETPWWAEQLEMNSGNALLWLLAAAAVFFLLLTVIHAFRAGRMHPDE